jgi:hypothetical protein
MQKYNFCLLHYIGGKLGPHIRTRTEAHGGFKQSAEEKS